MSCRGGQTGRDGRGGRERGRSRGGRGGSFGRAARDCIDFKLLGECERYNVGECWYSHTNQESNASVTVEIPDKVPMIMATKRFQGALRKIVECCVKVTGSTSVDIVVSQSNAHRLAELEREYKILLSQLYPIGPGWCYIHRDGIERCQSGRALLHFNPYEGRQPLRPGDPRISKSPLYELCVAEKDSDERVCTVDELDAKSPQRASETKEGLYKAIDRVHGDEPFDPSHNRKDVGVKIMNDHETHMKETLKGGLEWFDKEKRGRGLFAVKLEGRVGKILWKNVPEDYLDSIWDIETFADLCHSNTRHSRIFTTDVKKESVGEIKQPLNEEFERMGILETFDIKFTDPRAGKERMAIDVRIKFEDGRPHILLAKKNEAKIVVFDVLSLHRVHDVRITLNYYEMVDQNAPEYGVVKSLLETVSLSNPDEATISLLSRSEDWNVNFIRHKKKEAFRVDDKHLVSVTNIRECQFEKESSEYVSITPDHYNKEHIEVEFHNLVWDCVFVGDVDPDFSKSPEKSLALHMENPTVPPGDIPIPWQPDIILEDFQEFLENLDSLNELLGSSP